MTQPNIEKAIRDYLNNHLDQIPQLARDEICDFIVTKICMSMPFEYSGQGEYKFVGDAEGWKLTVDGGKSRLRFKIEPALAYISERDGNPIVEKVTTPVIIKEQQ